MGWVWPPLSPQPKGCRRRRLTERGSWSLLGLGTLPDKGTYSALGPMLAHHVRRRLRGK